VQKENRHGVTHHRTAKRSHGWQDKKGLLAVIHAGALLPAQWEDGAYSVQGAAELIGVYPGAIHEWLKTGRIHGKQIRKATPWKVFPGATEITQLRMSGVCYVQRIKRSKKEVS
jgi:hypothetical protein